MKKAISLLLALVLCLSLCACGKDSGLANNPTKKPADAEPADTVHVHQWTLATCEAPNICQTCGETEGNALGHTWSNATCTTPKTCSVCGETEGNALDHDYVDGECTRCKATDPEMVQVIKDYEALVAKIAYYEENGAVYAGNNHLYGSYAVGYLYDELMKMGEFRDCAQYLERIAVLPDQLLYIKLLETDNLGNYIKSTDLEYEYDALGRVTMSEDAEFLNQLGILRNTYASGVSQNYVTITYGDDGRIVEYRLYYVQLVEIITPTYDESGRIQSAYHKENVGGYTTYFDYDDHGRLIRVWDDVKDYAILYTYNSDGTLVSKTCEGDYWDAWFKDSMKEYQYDEHGNLVGWTSGSIVPTVEFDDQGRIVREHIVKSNGVLNYEYVYGSWYVYTNLTSGT